MKTLFSILAMAFTALVSNAVQAEGGPAAPSVRQGSSPAPDDTGRNQRDQGGAGLEATDQSNRREDVELTSRIRRALTDDGSLSMNAHNVKIITVNGRVTLRGPVDSEAERRKVEAMARRIAGQHPVTNELEVNKR